MKEKDDFEHNLELGQHFLIDEKIIARKILEAGLSKEDRVIEVGAGKGVLTEKLAEKSKEVLAFEIDHRLSVFLDILEKEHKNLKIVYGNALDAKFSWKGYNKIVSNIPYALAEPLIRKAIESNTDELLLIVGENFRDTIVEGKGKVGIVTNLFFKIKPIIEIKKESFHPQPKVDSWLVRFERKRKSTKEERVLQNIVLKKGKIKNAIVMSLVSEGLTKNQSKDFVRKTGLHENVLNKPVGSITGRVLEEIRKGLSTLNLF